MLVVQVGTENCFRQQLLKGFAMASKPWRLIFATLKPVAYPAEGGGQGQVCPPEIFAFYSLTFLYI